METVPYNCSATEIAKEANAVEVALNSSAQSGTESPSLGVPVKNVLSPQDIISEDYVPPQDYQWFYMNASYGKNLMAQEELAKAGIFSYIPYETLRGDSSDGTKTLTRRPIFTSYLFVFAPLDVIRLFVRGNNSDYYLPYLHFVYNRTAKDEFGANMRMIVPHKAMVNFIRLAEFNTFKVHRVDIERVNFVKGEPVKIVEGVFKGIYGRVARIHNQTTVVVTLEGIISMTTAYIPKRFMKPLSEDKTE